MRFTTLAATAAVASTAFAETVLTGDILQGYPIIESLDVADTPSDTISRYWFLAGQGQGGLNYFVPVFVARGSNDTAESGPRLSVSASIHGDELNPVGAVQQFFRQLNESGVVQSGDFNGTIIGIPTMNQMGNALNQRNLFTSTNNGFFVDLNRNFPGTSLADGGNLPTSYADAIWQNIWANGSNVDIAVDFHTLSTGADGPLWAFADYRQEGVQRMTEIAELDVILIDPGQVGSIETSFIEAGIPAITVEIGPAKNWNQTLIQRTVEYLFRLVDDQSMTSADNSTAEERYQPDLSNTYIATNFTSASVSYSGWVQMAIQALDDVEEGQVIATVYNSWGDALENVTSPVTGKALTVRVDPAIEQGTGLGILVYNATSEES